MPRTNDDFPRLSRTELAALKMIVRNGEMFGLEMVGQSAGQLKKGTLYVTLNQLTRAGYLTSRMEDRKAPEIGIPRKFYKAAESGKRLYAAYEAARKVWQGEKE